MNRVCPPIGFCSVSLALYLGENEAMESANTLEIGTMIIGLFGGLALFLYGMDQLTSALKIVAGGRMKGFLKFFAYGSGKKMSPRQLLVGNQSI